MKGREWRFQQVVNEGRSYFLRRDIAYGSWGAILALFHEGGSTKSTKNKFFLIKSSKFHFKVLKNVFRTFLPEKIFFLRKKFFWYLLILAKGRFLQITSFKMTISRWKIGQIWWGFFLIDCKLHQLFFKLKIFPINIQKKLIFRQKTQKKFPIFKQVFTWRPTWKIVAKWADFSAEPWIRVRFKNWLQIRTPRGRKPTTIKN